MSKGFKINDGTSVSIKEPKNLIVTTKVIQEDCIPIEWIEEYRQNREDYADEYNAKAVLKRLLETWEKENEID